MTTNHWIARFEVTDAVAIAKDVEPGTYTLRGLIGETTWQWILRKTLLGRRFKAWVLHDDIPNVRWAGEKSNKSQIYKVTKSI